MMWLGVSRRWGKVGLLNRVRANRLEGFPSRVLDLAILLPLRRGSHLPPKKGCEGGRLRAAVSEVGGSKCSLINQREQGGEVSSWANEEFPRKGHPARSNGRGQDVSVARDGQPATSSGKARPGFRPPPAGSDPGEGPQKKKVARDDRRAKIATPASLQNDREGFANEISQALREFLFDLSPRVGPIPTGILRALCLKDVAVRQARGGGQ